MVVPLNSPLSQQAFKVRAKTLTRYKSPGVRSPLQLPKPVAKLMREAPQVLREGCYLASQAEHSDFSRSCPDLQLMRGSAVPFEQVF